MRDDRNSSKPFFAPLFGIFALSILSMMLFVPVIALRTTAPTAFTNHQTRRRQSFWAKSSSFWMTDSSVYKFDLRPLNRMKQRQSSMFMSSRSKPFSSLDVVLDKPVVDPAIPSSPLSTKNVLPQQIPTAPATTGGTSSRVSSGISDGASSSTVQQVIEKSIKGLLASNVFRSIMVGLCAAFLVSLIIRGDNLVANAWKGFQGLVQRSLDKFKSGTKYKEEEEEEEEEGIPMPFEDNDGNDGAWSVCTLRSKRRLGKTSYIQYDFDLPNLQYYLPLELGQEITLCCLDDDDNVVKGAFFPYTPVDSTAPNKPSTVTRLGTFSILAPNRLPDENEYAVGGDTANFVRVLKTDLKVGDEVAIQCGENKLLYRGQYLPVTDMVYIAFGVGVVPVFDQIRNVLPNEMSSVQNLSVVWINEDAKDFDVVSEQLEQEYFKYSTKLAVSCIVDDLKEGTRTLHDNIEVDQAIPPFVPGTMAVLAGPEAMMEKTVEYLEDRGYPSDCICVM